MFKKINCFLSFSLAALLFFAVILPEVAVADSGELNFEMSTDFSKDSEEITDFVDEYLEKNGIFDIDLEKLTEKEVEEYFDQLLSTEEYLTFENELNYMTQDNPGGISTRALPIVLAPIGIMALRILVTQGSKSAIAYLKKATKNLAKTYKITFPNPKTQLILIQDKKSKDRIFSIDKHAVKMVQKKNNKKGYPGSISPWHFHVGKNSGHLMLCSSVPKNYKVEKGKCYF